MLTFITILGIGVLWFLLTLLFDKLDKSNYYYLSRKLSITTTVIVLTLAILNVSCTRIGFKKDIMDYYALKELVESNRMEDLAPIERIGILEKIHTNNRIINFHRAYIDNIWLNWWCSEEIAQLPYLK